MMRSLIHFRLKTVMLALKSGRRGFCLIAVAPLLGSCGGGSPEPAVTLPEPEATRVVATFTPGPSAIIGDIVWATGVVPGSNEPFGVVEAFDQTQTELYAVVRVSNLRANSVVSAMWSFNDTPIDRITTGVVPAADYPEGNIAFHLERAGDRVWPDGIYAIALSVDGNVIQTARIEVRTP